MKNRKLFDKIIGWLVQAWMDEELQANNCAACAVGNICMRSVGGKYNRLEWGKFSWLEKNFDYPTPEYEWEQYFFTTSRQGVSTQEKMCEVSKGADSYMIKTTGLNMKQLAKIEFVFEAATSAYYHNKMQDAPRIRSEDAHFAGLMACVDLLERMLLGSDQQANKQARERFRKPKPQHLECITSEV